MFILSFDYVLKEGSMDSLDRLNHTSPARQEPSEAPTLFLHSIIPSVFSHFHQCDPLPASALIAYYLSARWKRGWENFKQIGHGGWEGINGEVCRRKYGEGRGWERKVLFAPVALAHQHTLSRPNPVSQKWNEVGENNLCDTVLQLFGSLRPGAERRFIYRIPFRKTALTKPSDTNRERESVRVWVHML